RRIFILFPIENFHNTCAKSNNGLVITVSRTTWSLSHPNSGVHHLSTAKYVTKKARCTNIMVLPYRILISKYS
ncbi:hypothetical protein TSAR_013712, partial [Trichomalopsis sarcophagae]